jgi:GT2 family glycosyltransferase
MSETPAADAWWVLNPDTQPDPEAMALQVERLSAGDCEAVGSTIYLPDGRVQSHGGRWSPWLARSESLGHGSALVRLPDPAVIERQQNYLNGASMMIGRRFLEAVGPMREEYFLYCEEVEWCLRGVQLGMRLGFAPGARVLHYVGTTTGSYDQITRRPRTPVYLNERNKMLTTWDRFPRRMPVAALSSLALIFVRFGRRGAWRQIGYGVAGWAAGLANVRGAPRWLAS